MMEKTVLKPNEKYRTKLFISLTLIAAVVFLGCLLFISLISLDRSVSRAGLLIALLICLGCDLLWYVPSMVLVPAYFDRLKYEIDDDEVVVHVGIINQAVKHVPFRTITNIAIHRGILDRLLDIGSLHIQTAGASDSSGKPEESLVGLVDVQAVYEQVAKELRRFRSGMAPTAAGMQGEAAAASPEVLEAILDELRGLREDLKD